MVDDEEVVVEEGIAHRACSTEKKARGKIINDRETLVENEIESHGLGTLAFTIDNELVIVQHNHRGKGRDVEHPFLAQHEIVAITSANAKMTHTEIQVGKRSRTIVTILDGTSLEGNSSQPRASRASLNVALRESSWIGETAIVEGIIGCHVQHFHVGIATLQVELAFTLDVARERLGTLETGIQADLAAVDIQIEFVIMVMAK